MRLSDLAKSSGVSVQSVYRAVKRLGKQLDHHLVKENGISSVDEEGGRLIKESLGSTTVKPVPVETLPSVVVQPINLDPLQAEMAELKRAMLAMAETMSLIRSENLELRKDNAAIRALLAPPVKAEEPKEKTFAEELREVQAGIADFLRGVVAPFTTLLFPGK